MPFHCGNPTFGASVLAQPNTVERRRSVAVVTGRFGASPPLRTVLGLPTFVERFAASAFDGEEVMLLAGRTALCLQAHKASSGERFDPCRAGLDHLAFAVESMDELEECAARLTEIGIEHSGIRPVTRFGHFIELRDPDGIQIELHLLSSR
jgi:catechol 2,3-dioxygenase-like lactoylglutathione lyase family enzyme